MEDCRRADASLLHVGVGFIIICVFQIPSVLVWFGSVGVIDTLGYNNKKIRKQSQAVDVYVSHSVFMNYAPDVLLGLIIIFQNAGVDYLTFDCLFDVLNTQI